MLVLGIAPRVVESFAARGIPERYARDTMRYLGGASIIFASGHGGLPGFNMRQMYWTRYYLDGTLYRIGRLEYMLHTVPPWVPPIFRRRSDGELAVLLADKAPIGKDMRNAPAGCEVIFTSSFRVRDNRAYGTPVDATGRAHIDREVSLDLAEWEPVVTPWEIVPSMHIPSGGGMTPERVKASLTEAVDFFPRYLGFAPRMFVCHSWIFNPAWEELLPESNMVKFLHELYMFSERGRSPGNEGLFFIFGRSDGDRSSYPADNSMRRAFHELFRSNRPARGGAAFILTSDIEHFGTGWYRKHYTDLKHLG